MALLVALPSIINGHEGHVHAEVPTDGSGDIGGIITVTDQGKRNLGIEVVEAEITEIEKTIEAIVEIKAVPSRTAVLSSRIPGKVKRISAISGQQVKANQSLVLIESFQPGNPPPSVSYQSPISGTVTHWDAEIGESVEPNGHLAEIIDLTEVFAEITLFEGQLSEVEIGQNVRVYVESFPGQCFEGTIELMSGKLDPDTRVLRVFATIPNPDLKLRPHMRGTAHIVTESLAAAIAIPHRAITGDPANLYAFVQTDEKGLEYEQRRIVIGTRDDRVTEVVEGVLPGEQVVVSGNYQLQFVESKSQIPAGGGHGHEHGPGGEHLTEADKAAHGEGTHHAHGHDHDHSHAGIDSDTGGFLTVPIFGVILGCLIISLIANVFYAIRQNKLTSA